MEILAIELSSAHQQATRQYKCKENNVTSDYCRYDLKKMAPKNSTYDEEFNRELFLQYTKDETRMIRRTYWQRLENNVTLRYDKSIEGMRKHQCCYEEKP